MRSYKKPEINLIEFCLKENIAALPTVTTDAERGLTTYTFYTYGTELNS